MGSKDSEDDPMNLGPFMATYVMGSPFGGLNLERDSSPEPLPSLKRVTLPPRTTTTTTTQSLPPPPILTPAPTAVVKLPLKDQLVPVPDPARGRHSSSNREKEKTIAEDTESKDDIEGDFVIIEDVRGMVVDTPKAHVGSNVHFAKSLKNCTVPENHQIVQQWLWQKYRFIPGYAAETSMDTLLEEVHTCFPHISRTALCRVLQFTYPNCPKKTVASKSNLFYFGLVRRPLNSFYKDEAVMARVMAHKQGLVHSGEVSDKVKEMTVSILCWEGHLDCFPTFTQIPIQPMEKVAKMAKAHGKSPRPEASSLPESTLDGTAADQGTTTRRLSLRQSQRKRQNVKRLFDDMDKMLEDVVSEAEDEEDDDDEFHDSDDNNADGVIDYRTTLPKLQFARSQDGIQRVAKRQALREDLQPKKKHKSSDGLAEEDVEDAEDVASGETTAEPMWSEIRSLIRGQKTGEELWKHVESIFASTDCVKRELPSPKMGFDENQLSQEDVTVKEEPVDPGYGDFDPAESPTGSNHSQQKTSSSTDSNTANLVHKLQSALTKARSVIDAQKSHLDEQTRQTSELRKELNAKNKQLQERDTDLHQLGKRFFGLATQFHCLNGEIQKFAGTFQAAINKSSMNSFWNPK